MMEPLGGALLISRKTYSCLLCNCSQCQPPNVTKPLQTIGGSAELRIGVRGYHHMTVTTYRNRAKYRCWVSPEP